MEPLIGLVGFAGSGKSLAADLLVGIFADNGVEVARLSFSTAVKNIARDSFGWDGEKDEKGRRLLQVIGTEAGRHYNPTIWLDKVHEEVTTRRATGVGTIIDDVRFVNEGVRIQELSGTIWRMFGRGGLNGSAGLHPSEIEVPRVKYDIEVDNDEGESVHQLKARLIDGLLCLGLLD